MSSRHFGDLPDNPRSANNAQSDKATGGDTDAAPPPLPNQAGPPPLPTEAGASQAAQSEFHLVSQTEIDTQRQILDQAAQQYEKLANRYRKSLSRQQAIERSINHDCFLQSCRKRVDKWGLGAVPAVVISIAASFLVVLAILAIFPLPTPIAFVSGTLSVGVITTVAVHLFMVPSDAALARRIPQRRLLLHELNIAIADDRTPMQKAKLVFDRARQRYQELLRIFESRRNQLLTTQWRLLRGVSFEMFLKDVFEDLGYSVSLTKASGDQGVDLILERDNRRIAVQAKGYAESVGNSAVQQAHAGMAYYGCHACAVVTNSCFTASAVDLASRIGCLLIDGSQIERLILGKFRI